MWIRNPISHTEVKEEASTGSARTRTPATRSNKVAVPGLLTGRPPFRPRLHRMLKHQPPEKHSDTQARWNHLTARNHGKQRKPDSFPVQIQPRTSLRSGRAAAAEARRNRSAARAEAPGAAEGACEAAAEAAARAGTAAGAGAADGAAAGAARDSSEPERNARIVQPSGYLRQFFSTEMAHAASPFAWRPGPTAQSGHRVRLPCSNAGLERTKALPLLFQRFFAPADGKLSAGR